MKTLITGATGFIGGHLVRHFVAQGQDVRVLVRRPSQELADAGVEQAVGEITDAEAARQAVAGMDAVFHLAGVRDSWGIPASAYQRVNVEGTRLLLAAAAEARVRRLVYCSSVGVARYPGNLSADETLSYNTPTSQVSYHRTKAQAEQMVLELAHQDRLPAAVVRPVIAYGPSDRHGMVTQLILLLSQGRFVPVGSGRNHVDLVYVDDLVTGMQQAMEHGAVGTVYILSGTRPVQMQALICRISELLGKKPPAVHIPLPVAHAAGWGVEMLYGALDRLRLLKNGAEPFVTRNKVATLTVDRGFSHARAARELGYAPQVDTDDGLQRTLAWLRAAGLLCRPR